MDAMREFMGRPVRHLFHMPRMPAPPGLGVFLNQFGGCINLTLAHLDGLLSPAQAAAVVAALQKL